MRSFASLAVLVSLLACHFLLGPAWSQELGKTQRSPQASEVHSGQNRAVNVEPMSIFNDQLRHFKFRLEHDVASTETAEEFMLRYKRPNNPRILGAYPDAQTNSLVVIGPPESEQAIRESLAEWIVETGGLGQSAPLAIQLRILQRERSKLLTMMAEVEVDQVKAAGTVGDEAKAPQLAARLQAFERELKIVEEQIRIVRKYMNRIDQEPAASLTGQ